MARTRGERRAAEDAARSKVAGMVTYIGDVGEAAAVRSAARAGVDKARTRAHQLLNDARKANGRSRRRSSGVTDADGRYAEAFNRAVDEGWEMRLLTDLGLRRTRSPRRQPANVDSGRHGVDN
jgi:hypothetical protein